MIKKLTYIFFFYLLAMAALIALAPLWWFFDLFTHFGVQFFAASLAVIGMLLYYHAHRSAIALAVVAVIVALPAFAVSIPRAAVSPAGTRASILQANVNKHNDDPARLIAVLRTTEPDIITLNEINPRFAHTLSEVIAPAYPYRIVAPRDTFEGMAIYSKVPIDTRATTTFGLVTPPSVRIAFAAPRFTLYAVHALSPIIPGWAVERDQFVDFLARNITYDTGTVIVAGDLNLTTFSPILQRFMKVADLHDSRAGFGVLPSWLADTLLALPLDQILYRGSVTVQNMEVLPDIGSDHRPVMATLYIN